MVTLPSALKPARVPDDVSAELFDAARGVDGVAMIASPSTLRRVLGASDEEAPHHIHVDLGDTADVTVAIALTIGYHGGKVALALRDALDHAWQRGLERHPELPPISHCHVHIVSALTESEAGA